MRAGGRFRVHDADGFDVARVFERSRECVSFDRLAPRRLDSVHGCAASLGNVGHAPADHAVLALPAPDAARLRGNIAEDDRKHIEAVRFVPNILLYFGYERPITVQYPLVTPAGPGRHPLARIRTISEWVPSYVPDGKEMVSVHATSWRSAELIDEEPEQIINALRRDTESIFGRLADPDWIRLYPRRNAVVLPVPGHYRRMRNFLRKPRKRVFYAGDWLTGSTIEGAVRTGINAAEMILAQ